MASATAVTVLLASLGSGSAIAQSARSASDAAATLRTVDVVADDLGTTTENSGSYTTGASTIGKRAQTLRETPQSVTVLTRQLLDDQNLRTLDEALLTTPGVTVQNSSSYERTYFSRGFQIETIQYDGVPTQRGSGFAISPDLALYDRVEVLRGPAGLFNGAGQPGGVVNLVRKRPLATRQFTGGLTLGRWNAKRADVDLSVPFNENGSLRGRVVAAREDRRFFYDRASTDRSLFYGIVEADVTSRTTLGLGLSHERNDMVPMYAALPRYTDGRDLGLPRSTNLNAAWAHTDVKTTTVFADVNHRFDGDWKLKAAFSRMREDNFDESGSNFGAINPVTFGGSSLSAFRQRLLGEQKAADASLQGSFAAFGRRHDVLVGANYQARDYDLRSQLFAVPNGSNINPFTFDASRYATFPTVPSRAATNTLNHVEQSGVYGSLRLALTDPLKLSLGGRMSQYRSSIRNLVTGAYTTAPYKENGEFTPFSALTYDLSPAWSAYASYAEIFQSQGSFFTASGERLKPMTGDNYELGLKGSLYGGKMNTSVALFRTMQQGRSQSDPNNPSPCAASPTGGACFIADGKVRSQGLDAEISGEMLPRWQVAAGYTFNATKYLRDRTATGTPSANENQPLSTFTPRHMLRVWTGYQLPGELSAWTVGGGVNLQSTTYRTAGVIRLEQAGYAVWSARVAYRINRNVQAALNVANAFDKTYYRTLGSTNSGNWYGDPRNVTLTMQAFF